MSTTAWSSIFLKELETRDRREKAYDDIISASPAAAGSQTLGGSTPSITSPTNNDDITRLRADFALAQQQHGVLTAEVRSLKKQLLTLSKAETERVRLKARVEELEKEVIAKERDRQLAADEQLAQEYQVNMMTDRLLELRTDNQELVERWMKLKAEEAEKMNRAMEWEERGGLR
ncbi:Similar to Autophagy protein 16; acc. no. Q4WVH5 [Pyronema omphalodes CBS 100304]|uniref:Similar to Autophagy protein 16 acc. no. Q4WVH5 n=1 Tax=Pyronema omphalodes (strain CBS 100304) TaxID=1076935 RepID=U4LTW8_PYROM|nr:Similar to Autophagy protein 16; acc. no. Q4WVH5 [Pyronema omphalodes CBS 100304]